MRKLACHLCLILAAAVGPLALGQPPPAANVPTDEVERRIYNDVAFLASDELGGRGPYSEGLERAAQHIASQWRKIGLATKLYGDEPFHVFATKAKVALGETNSLVAHLPSEASKPALGIDFTPLSLTSAGKFSGEAVFAGYGIASPELGYDDYDGIDVAGKAVIVLRHQPLSADPKGPFGSKALSPHAYLSAKCAKAAALGASAVIIVTDQRNISWQPAKAEAKDLGAAPVEKLMGFQVEAAKRPAGASDKPLLVVHISRAECDRWLAGCGSPALSTVEQEIDARVAPRSFPLAGLRLEIETTLATRKQSLKNVLGAIPGTGTLKEEVVVVGAHYDHLGFGGGGSLAPWTMAPHNGADDNASGTASLIEAARDIARRRRALDAPADCRTIVFIAFSAEEMGLIGSARYVRAPLFPLDKTVAMVNLDMVGRLRKKLVVSGTGTAKEFSSLVGELGKKHELDVALDPSGYGPSDHASFYERGVPVLHFFTGLHGDYHRPSDDTEKLNYAGMKRIVAMTVDTVMRIAEASERPQKAKVVGEMNLLGGLDLDESPAAATRPTKHGLGIQLKTVDGKLVVERVVPKSPAELGQLRPGDVILKADQREIEDVASLRAAVLARRWGETLTLVVLRGELELELSIALNGSGRPEAAPASPPSGESGSKSP